MEYNIDSWIHGGVGKLMKYLKCPLLDQLLAFMIMQYCHFETFGIPKLIILFKKLNWDNKDYMDELKSLS